MSNTECRVKIENEPKVSLEGLLAGNIAAVASAVYSFLSVFAGSVFAAFNDS